MGSKRVAGSVAAMAIAILCGPAFAQVQQPSGSWSPEADGNTFYYGAAVTDGAYLYLVGGYQNGPGVTSYPYVMAQFRRYDPAAGSWTTLPQMAAGTATGSALWGVRYHAAGYHDGRVFVFGGYVYSGTVGSSGYSAAYSNAIRRFDFATQSWTTSGATLSSQRYYHAAATLNDRIYIAGGVNSNVLEIFNPAGDAISPGTSLPGNLYYHGLAAVPALNKIYAMGGYGPGGYTGINYEYTPQDNDPATNDVGGVWVTRANISNNGVQQPLYYVAAMTLNNRVYLAGGYNSQTGAINQTFEYNPFTNAWTQRASMALTHYRHGAVAINGKGYVYGGQSNPNDGEEFTPPDFGSAPFVTGGVLQEGATPQCAAQAQADSELVDGWTNGQIAFSAAIGDPDPGQLVRLRVQVKPASASWTQASQVTSLDTGLISQGLAQLAYNIPAGGAYDWRWRVEDAFSNSFPETPGTWAEAFDNALSPDFRSDQEPPADPVALFPKSTDIQVTDPLQGPVLLGWQESTDNAPTVGIQYELQVARDGGFLDIEAQLFSPAGTSEFPTTLSVSRYTKHWRLRARDIGGNLSEWSEPLGFRVTYDDGENHSSGDARRNCGFSAGPAGFSLSALLGALAILSLGRRARK